MKLEEARNEAELLEGLVDYGQDYPPHLSDGEEACIVLNHRITELEAQRDELIRALTQIKCELSPYKTNIRLS